MGAALSANVTTMVNSDITNVFNESVSSCTSTSQQEAKFEGGDNAQIILNRSKITQIAKVDTNCLSKQFNETDMESRIKQKLVQSAATKIDGLTFGFTASMNVATSVNSIVKDINVKNIQSTISGSFQSMSAKVGNNGLIEFQDGELNQSSDIINKAVFEALSKSSTMNAVETDFENKLKTEKIGLFSTAFLGVLVLLVGLYFVMSGGSGKKRLKKWAEKRGGKTAAMSRMFLGSPEAQEQPGMMYQQQPQMMMPQQQPQMMVQQPQYGMMQPISAVPMSSSVKSMRSAAPSSTATLIGTGSPRAVERFVAAAEDRSLLYATSLMGNSMIIACILIVALLSLYFVMTS